MSAPLYTSTVNFDSRQEAVEFLEVMGFRRLPVKGPIERYSAEETGDEGEPLLTFASSAGRNDNGEVVAYHLVTFPRKR
jgi:hypothetical protein